MANEFVNQVKEDVSAYLNTETIVGKLRLVGGISRLLGMFLLMLTIVLLCFGFIAFCGAAAVIALSCCMPAWAAALVVGAIYLALIVIAIACRKQLFINPFVKLLSGIFFAKEGREAEEERLREEALND